MLKKGARLAVNVLVSAYGYRYDRSRDTSKCKADENEPWTYRGRNGPQFWGERYPTCNSHAQSPIDIDRHTVIEDGSLSKLSLVNYDIPVSRATILNNGHTVQVTPSDGVERTIYVNGDTYRLTQLHFHWGETASRGAEHTVDGHSYSMEMHLVHESRNSQVAVVGVFFQEQRKDNSELEILIDHFPQVKYKDMTTQLKRKFNLNYLVPGNPSSFFRYQGSLTTPACTEGVTWSVLTKALPVGRHQMKEFRKLYSATRSEATRKCKISENYRPVQPLNRRTVYISK